MASLVAATSHTDEMNVVVTQSFYSFGMTIIMVMAILAVTTEYRFSTIKSTFLAVPNRTKVLLAKARVIALISGIVGEVCAFGAWGMSKLILPDAPLGLSDAKDWRTVAGMGLVYALAALMAIGAGLLVRQSAGAITLVLVYSLLVENLFPAIPRIGEPVHRWMPFVNADHFLRGGQTLAHGNGPEIVAGMHYGPWGGLLYFAAWAFVILGAGLYVTSRRDA
jgi:ABC-2 type transport system permease protein